MAKVHTGKIVVSGANIQDYLKLLQEAERQREPFRNAMDELNEEFHEHLLTRFKRNTARKHTMIVDLFIEFLCRHTDVERVEDITRGMANTHFKNWWKKKVWNSMTPEQIRVSLKKFFTFLANEKGMVNEKVLNSFK